MNRYIMKAYKIIFFYCMSKSKFIISNHSDLIIYRSVFTSMTLLSFNLRSINIECILYTFTVAAINKTGYILAKKKYQTNRNTTELSVDFEPIGQ